MLTLWIGLAASGAAWAHPLDSCDVHRGSVPDNTTVTFACGAHQVSERTYVGRSGRSARLEQFHEELKMVGKALGTEVTWNTADLELGGASRPVAQYTLKAPEGVVRTGLVATKDDGGRQLVDCSTPDTANATVCRELVDAILTHGLPDGVSHLPLPREVRKATVLGQTVKVILGCKALFVFDDAIHVRCSDGEMIFGSENALMEGPDDPIAMLHASMSEAPGFEASEVGCTVAGVSAKCWQGRATVGGVRRVAWTSRLDVAGEPAQVQCLQTAVGSDLHVQCAEVMAIP